MKATTKTKIVDVLEFLESSLPSHVAGEVWRKLNDKQWGAAKAVLEREREHVRLINKTDDLNNCIAFLVEMGA